MRGVVEGDGFDLAQLFAEHSDFGGGEIEMHFAFEELETEFLKDLLTRLYVKKEIHENRKRDSCLGDRVGIALRCGQTISRVRHDENQARFVLREGVKALGEVFQVQHDRLGHHVFSVCRCEMALFFASSTKAPRPRRRWRTG